MTATDLADEVAALHLPVRIDATTDEVVVHLGADLTAADEAHLLNLLAHRACHFHLDRAEGPERAVQPLPDGWWAAFTAKRPEYA